MTQKKKRLYLILGGVALTVTLATVILRLIALLRSFDAALGYFTSPTLSTVMTSLLIAVVLFAAVFTHELKELFSFSPDYRDLPTLFSAAFSVIALALFAFTFPGEADTLRPLALTMAILSVPAALGSAVLFALRIFRPRAESRRLALLSLCPVLLSLLIAFYYFFESSTMLNNPNKLLAQCAWLFVVFFFLGEARIALGRAKWALHTCISILTVVFTATASLPALVYHAAEGAPLLGSTMHDFLLFAFFLYSTSRACACLLSAFHQATPAVRFATAEELAEPQAAKDAPLEDGQITLDFELNDEPSAPISLPEQPTDAIEHTEHPELLKIPEIPEAPAEASEKTEEGE